MKGLGVASLSLLVLLISASSPVSCTTTTEDWLQKARGHLAQGQTQAAIDAYSGALEIDPTDALTLYKRALLQLGLQKRAAALKDLDSVLVIKPGFSQALVQRGRLFKEEGRYEEALRDFEAQIGQSPTDSDAISAKQETLHALELVQSADKALSRSDCSSAIELLSQAIQLSGHNSDLWLKRADCHVALHNTELAIRDLRNVLNLKPDNSALYIKLSALRMTLGEVSEALGATKECLRLDPDQKACKKKFKELRKLDKALTSLESAVKLKMWTSAKLTLFGKDGVVGTIEGGGSKVLMARVYRYACQSLYNLKQLDEALKFCSKTLHLDESNTIALTTRAEIKLEQEDYDDALRDYQKAHELDQQNEDIMRGYQKAQRLKRQAGRRDYYKVLGVSRSASQKEIKRAFRKLAQQWHPDKYQGDLPKDQVEKKMSELNQAYEVLSNEELKTRFDNGDDPNDQQSGFGGGNPFAGFPGGFPGGSPFGGGGFRFQF